MTERKVDEAARAAERALWEWQRSVRVILRYGNWADISILSDHFEEVDWCVDVFKEKLGRRMTTEFDRGIADLLIKEVNEAVQGGENKEER